MVVSPLWRLTVPNRTENEASSAFQRALEINEDLGAYHPMHREVQVWALLRLDQQIRRSRSSFRSTNKVFAATTSNACV